MTDEELDELVTKSLLALDFDARGRIAVARETLRAVASRARAEALEEAAGRAFEAVKAVDGRPYSTLQKAASVAASVRALESRKGGVNEQESD